MTEAANLWVAIRPHINVTGATNTSPILLSTRADTMISTGDQITVDGVLGNTGGERNLDRGTGLIASTGATRMAVWSSMVVSWW